MTENKLLLKTINFFSGFSFLFFRWKQKRKCFSFQWFGLFCFSFFSFTVPFYTLICSLGWKNTHMRVSLRQRFFSLCNNEFDKRTKFFLVVELLLNKKSSSVVFMCWSDSFSFYLTIYLKWWQWRHRKYFFRWKWLPKFIILCFCCVLFSSTVVQIKLAF